MPNTYDFSGPFVSAAIITDPKDASKRFPLWSLEKDSKLIGSSDLNGLKALAFLTDVTVKQHLGMVPTISVQLQPPFEDARKLLDSAIIEWGTSLLEVTLGYSTGVPDGTVLGKYEGILLKPEISLGVDTTITLNAQGVGGFAASTGSSTKTWSKTAPLDVLKEIFAKKEGGLEVDTSKIKGDDAETFLKKKKDSISQSGYTDWFFAQTIAKSAGCWGFEVGKKFQLVSKNGVAGGEPVWKFRLFDFPEGQVGGSKGGVFPILGVSTPTLGIFIAGAAKALRAVGTDSKTRKEVVVVVKDSKSKVKSTDSKSAGIKSQQPEDDEAQQLAIDGAAKEAKGMVEAEYQTARNGMGVVIEIETVGMPDLLPGNLVEVKGVADRIDGKFIVMDLEHSIGSGGFTTKFKGVTNTAAFSAKQKDEIAPTQPNKAKVNEKAPEATLGPKSGTFKVEPVNIDTTAIESLALFGFK